MFTGIVEEIGTIRKIDKGVSSCSITVQADKVLHAPEVVARMAEEAFHTVGNGEAAPGNETFPDNVGYEGIAG